MSKDLLVLGTLVLGTACFAQTTPDDLLAGSHLIEGEALKARVQGKSFIWKAANSRATAKVQYGANGHAFINVSGGQNDSGPWRVEGGRLCADWRQLPAACAPEVRLKGDVLLVKRPDGTWASMTPD